MRITNDENKLEGYVIRYPEEISFCFNPEMIEVTSSKGDFEMTVEFSTADGFTATKYADKRDSFNGKSSLNISSYTRLFFNRKNLGEVSRFSSTGSELNVAVKLKLKSPDAEQSVFNFKSFCIWGAVNIGETFNPNRTLTWFRNFPTSISAYVPVGTKICKRVDNGSYSEPQNSEDYKVGIINMDLSYLFSYAKRYAVLRLDYSSKVFGVFDVSFDYTFQLLSDNTSLIRLNIDDSTEGTFLRWIDRQGFYQYYLFQDGDVSIKTKDQGATIQEDIFAFNRYYNGIARAQGKTTEQSNSLCAPLVDSQTYNLLTGILSSPIVDMFYGYDKDNKPVFIPVSVNGGTKKVSGDAYKDFEIEIGLPETITQQL